MIEQDIGSGRRRRWSGEGDIIVERDTKDGRSLVAVISHDTIERATTAYCARRRDPFGRPRPATELELDYLVAELVHLSLMREERSGLPGFPAKPCSKAVHPDGSRLATLG